MSLNENKLFALLFTTSQSLRTSIMAVDSVIVPAVPSFFSKKYSVIYISAGLINKIMQSSDISS